LRKAEWVVYAKRPLAGPQAVLAYFSRYPHRVAIANSRLVALDRTAAISPPSKTSSIPFEPSKNLKNTFLIRRPVHGDRAGPKPQ
jgi:hypothetical protein